MTGGRKIEEGLIEAKEAVSEIGYVAKALADAESLNWRGLTDDGRKRRMKLAAEAICALDRYRRATTAPRIVNETD